MTPDPTPAKATPSPASAGTPAARATPAEPSGARGDVSLIDVLVVLVRYWRLVTVVTVGAMLLGLVYSFVATPQYMAHARLTLGLLDEQPAPGGLAALRSLNLGGSNSTSGVSPEAYPDLLRSREVVLSVAQDTFYFSDLDRSMTYVAYVNREKGWWEQTTDAVKDNTVGALRRLLAPAPPARRASPTQAGGRPSFSFPTMQEEKAIKSLRYKVKGGFDIDTGMFRLSARASTPLLAFQLVNVFANRLGDRVDEIRTRKARRTLEFAQRRFAEAEQELMQAEGRLAEFLDRNRNPESAQLRVEQDRLQRRVRFKRDLYSDMQAQMAQAELDLQRSQPVLMVVEAPAPPLFRSSPNRTMALVLSIVLGFGMGLGIAFVLHFLHDQERSGDEQAKLDEIVRPLRSAADHAQHLWARVTPGQAPSSSDFEADSSASSSGHPRSASEASASGTTSDARSAPPTRNGTA